MRDRVDDHIAARFVLAQIGLLPHAAPIHLTEELVHLAQRSLFLGILQLTGSKRQRLAQRDDMKRLAILVDALESQRRKGRMVAEFHLSGPPSLMSTTLSLIVNEDLPQGIFDQERGGTVFIAEERLHRPVVLVRLTPTRRDVEHVFCSIGWAD